ncbi:unnamed protein product, partial [Prorocentrum cordatum]
GPAQNSVAKRARDLDVDPDLDAETIGGGQLAPAHKVAKISEKLGSALDHGLATAMGGEASGTQPSRSNGPCAASLEQGKGASDDPARGTAAFWIVRLPLDRTLSGDALNKAKWQAEQLLNKRTLDGHQRRRLRAHLDLRDTAMNFWLSRIDDRSLEDLAADAEKLAAVNVALCANTKMTITRKAAKDSWAMLKCTKQHDATAIENASECVLQVLRPWRSPGQVTFEVSHPCMAAAGLSDQSVAEAVVHEVWANNICELIPDDGVKRDHLETLMQTMEKLWDMPVDAVIGDKAATAFVESMSAKSALTYVPNPEITLDFDTDILDTIRELHAASLKTSGESSVFSAVGLAIKNDVWWATKFNAALNATKVPDAFWKEASNFARLKVVTVADHFLRIGTREELRANGNEERLAFEALSPLIKAAVVAFPSDDHLRNAARCIRDAVNHLSNQDQIIDLTTLADTLVADGTDEAAESLLAKADSMSQKALQGNHEAFRSALEFVSASLTMDEIVRGESSVKLKIPCNFSKAFSKEMPEHAKIYNAALECSQALRRLEAIESNKDAVGPGGMPSPKFENELTQTVRSKLGLKSMLSELPADSLKGCRAEVDDLVARVEKTRDSLAHEVVEKYAMKADSSKQNVQDLIKFAAVEEWMEQSSVSVSTAALVALFNATLGKVPSDRLTCAGDMLDQDLKKTREKADAFGVKIHKQYGERGEYDADVTMVNSLGASAIIMNGAAQGLKGNAMRMKCLEAQKIFKANNIMPGSLPPIVKELFQNGLKLKS